MEILLQNQPLLYIATAIISFFAARLWKGRSAAHKKAEVVATKLRDYGFVEIPVLLEEFAAGDHAGVARQIAHLYAIVHDEGRLKEELTNVAKRLVAKKLTDGAMAKLLEDKPDE